MMQWEDDDEVFGGTRTNVWQARGHSPPCARIPHVPVPYYPAAQLRAPRLYPYPTYTQSPNFFMELKRGDFEDHAVYLCNLLLGMNLDAYVCCGRLHTAKKGEKRHVWVMVRDDDGLVRFWETSTGDDVPLPARWRGEAKFMAKKRKEEEEAERLAEAEKHKAEGKGGDGGGGGGGADGKGKKGKRKKLSKKEKQKEAEAKAKAEADAEAAAEEARLEAEEAAEDAEVDEEVRSMVIDTVVLLVPQRVVLAACGQQSAGPGMPSCTLPEGHSSRSGFRGSTMQYVVRLYSPG